ncbi:MAG: serine hydrolase [Pseudomonadota bacterium]
MSLPDRLRAALEDHSGPQKGGVAYSVVQDGDIIDSGWLGDPLLTPDAPFRVCSITKQMTALMILMAQEEGLLQLNDPVRKFCPNAKLCSQDVTLDHALTNQSGIKDYWCLAMAMGALPESEFARADTDRLLESALSPDFAPGTRFAYSNTNFALLGRVLEAVHDKPFPALIKDKLFGPLGMDSSFVPASTSVPLPNELTGYEPDGRVAITNIHWEGDAGVVSTAHDMSRWQLAILDLDHPWASLFQRMTAPGHYADGARAPYRFGIRRRVRGGQLELAHFGGLRGWRSASLLQPSTGTGVVLFHNHMADPAPPAQALLDIAVNAPRPAEDTGVDGPEIAHETAHETTQVLYDDRAGLAATATQKGGEMTVRCGSQSWTFVDGDLRSETNDGGRFNPQNGSFHMTLARDNVSMQLRPLSQKTQPRLGTYRSDILESDIVIDETLRFIGPLGTSEPYSIKWLYDDLALVDCVRALDYDPPGQFTLAFDEAGLRLGCWSFQNIRFDKVAA